MTKIGVFDSGLGGLSVAETLQQALPDDDIIFVNDSEHMPYGDKSPADVLKLVLPKLQELVEQDCELIVIACNTVTTTLIDKLRATINVPLVGIEPMVKPAAEQTQTGIIAVCATPATLASKRYAWLKEKYAAGVKVLEPDCRRWAYLIEHGKADEIKLRELISGLCDQGADVIVLGCTHFHWIEEIIRRVAGQRAIIMQPEQAVVERVKQALVSL